MLEQNLLSLIKALNNLPPQEALSEGRNSVKDAFEHGKPKAFCARQHLERISPAAPPRFLPSLILSASSDNRSALPP